MKIVVIGGSGLIGSKLVETLRAAGHEVVAASPSTGVNALTGEGLDVVLRGAQVVVDVANSPSFEDAPVLEFFETSSRNVLAAEAAAGVMHHVALSVVGTDRLPDSGYLRAKHAQERLIEASPVPFTILRATQFFEFVGRIADGGTENGVAHLAPALMQPIAADDVVAALAAVAVAAPQRRVLEVAGPESLGLDELARLWFRAKGVQRTIVADAQARYFGTVIDDQSLRPGPDARLGSTHYAQWLARP